MIKAFIFLGNPGKQYKKTRHNFSWLVADLLSEQQNLSWQQKCNGEYAKAVFRGSATYLFKPLTFMNNCGSAVERFLRFFRLQTEECCVLHDDLETKFGMYIFKNGGGLGGHNGLKSIKNSLKTDSFFRIKLGISRPKKGLPGAYVLQQFAQDEEPFLPDLCRSAVDFMGTSVGTDVKAEKVTVFEW